MSPSSRVAVFIHSGDYDRMHQGLSIAAAAAAQERPTDVFFFWWALERLAKGELDDPIFTPPREDVSDRFEALGAPTLEGLIAHLRESGRATFYACSGSLALIGMTSAEIEKRVDQVVGWSHILRITAGVVDRFYV